MRLLRLLFLGLMATGLAACAAQGGPPTVTPGASSPPRANQPARSPDAGFQRYMGGGPTYF